MTLVLFYETMAARIVVAMGEQAFVLRGFALDDAQELLDEIARIEQASPFRNM